MTDNRGQSGDEEPVGDADPKLIYMAVGMSIHRWEAMEQAFARLYLKFSGSEDKPDDFFSFGQENGTFTKRMDAIVAAPETYFVRSPGQHKGGEFQALVQRALDLSIERHRIAHGHVVQWAR